MDTVQPPAALDRALILAFCVVGPATVAAYFVGGQWRTAADYGYTVMSAGVLALFAWMMLADGAWEQSHRQGRELWGRFGHRYPTILTKRLTGWVCVSVLVVNLVLRIVGHIG